MDDRDWHFYDRAFRAMACPLLGAVFGSLGSGLTLITLFAFDVVRDAQHGFPPLGEMLVGSVYLGLLSVIHDFFPSLATGICMIPIVFLARRRTLLDAIIVTSITAISAYIIFDGFVSSEFSDPAPIYLLPRVMACTSATGVVWLLGRHR
jgi:hypothetical protein